MSSIYCYARALGGRSRRRLAPAGPLLLGAAVVLLPVAVRNRVVGGQFYLTTSQFGPNFFIGNNARSDGTYMSRRFGRGAPEYEQQDATDLAEQRGPAPDARIAGGGGTGGRLAAGCRGRFC